LLNDRLGLRWKRRNRRGDRLVWRGLLFDHRLNLCCWRTCWGEPRFRNICGRLVVFAVVDMRGSWMRFLFLWISIVRRPDMALIPALGPATVMVRLAARSLLLGHFSCLLVRRTVPALICLRHVVMSVLMVVIIIIIIIVMVAISVVVHVVLVVVLLPGRVVMAIVGPFGLALVNISRMRPLPFAVRCLPLAAVLGFAVGCVLVRG
jgi:hypothetical protein